MKIAYKIREDLVDSEIDFIPKPAINGSAGYDLSYMPNPTELKPEKKQSYIRYTSGKVLLYPGGSVLLSTGINLDLPEGIMGHVCSRSGLAAKNQIFVLNSPGIVDPEYYGEIKVILYNGGEDTFGIDPCDRIAQLVFVPFYSPKLTLDPNFDNRVNSLRGNNGFGSTGK